MNKLNSLYDLQFQFDKLGLLKKEEQKIKRDYSIIENGTKKKYSEWKQLKSKVKNLKTQLTEKELEFRTLDEKRMAYEKTLYSTYAPKTSRELQELQQKIENMTLSNQTVEETTVNLINDVEKEELYLIDMEKQFDRCKEDFKKEKAFFVFRMSQIEKEKKEANEKIKYFRSMIPQDLLEEFDLAFSRGQQTGAVNVVAGTCSGCNTVLSERLLDSLRKKPNILHYCENCSRIIVITDD
jgi:predicted  nucleic acid-binding Zn-ribbon protein